MRPATPRRRTTAAVSAAALLATLACVDAPTTPPSSRAATRPAAAIATPPASNKADLVVQSVSHSPASPTDADLVTFSATVANVGQNKAPKAFDVRFDFGDGTSELVSAPALAGGASVALSTTPRLLAAGTYTATVTADYGDKIKEGDETNNAATQAYTVTNHNLITFEVDASGNPICPSGCDLTTEFANRGVTFSYESNVTSQTNASICDGSRIDPPALVASGNHEVTGPSGYPCGGTATGVLVMSFTGAPTTVQFVLRAPETCTATPVSVTAAGTGTPSVSYTTTDRYLYNGTPYYALQRTAVVTNTTGIAAIRVSIDGCAEYVDDLLITP
ncbi:MAG TPA: CARDB domain-containing protein [Gemmatimonadaceae bacterium]|nr:CARDB domain-containing protein [Gemmatimonadaceae bacterium]